MYSGGPPCTRVRKMLIIDGQFALVHVSQPVSSLQAVWRILHNYYKVREWHSSSETTSSGEGQEASEETFNRNYVRTKLENGLLRVWRVRIKSVHVHEIINLIVLNYTFTFITMFPYTMQCTQDVQQKVRPYLLAADMSQFKYDDFLRVLEIVNRFVHMQCDHL